MPGIAELGLRNAIKNINSNLRALLDPHFKLRALICHGLKFAYIPFAFAFSVTYLPDLWWYGGSNKYLDEWVSLLVQSKLTTKWYNDQRSVLCDRYASRILVETLVRLKAFPFEMDTAISATPITNLSTGCIASSVSQTAISGDHPSPTVYRQRAEEPPSNPEEEVALSKSKEKNHIWGAAWGRLRNSNNGNNNRSSSEPTEEQSTENPKRVKFWGNLWRDKEAVGSNGDSFRASWTRLFDTKYKSRAETMENEDYGDGGDDLDDSFDDEVKIERLDEFKVEVKEITQDEDIKKSAISFFRSWLD